MTPSCNGNCIVVCAHVGHLYRKAAANYKSKPVEQASANKQTLPKEVHNNKKRTFQKKSTMRCAACECAKTEGKWVCLLRRVKRSTKSSLIIAGIQLYPGKRVKRLIKLDKGRAFGCGPI